MRRVACLLTMLGAARVEAGNPWSGLPAGDWGVDAVLSRHVSSDELPAYLSLLKGTGIRWVRERGIDEPGPRGRFALQRDHGLRIVAFAQEIRGVGGTEWGPFPEDLRRLWDVARKAGYDHAGELDAWELHNEPELAWWPDMPDRYAAQAKALYLGLKAGAHLAGKDTPVLLGALGLPPGPWLERSARCGLLDYADAWNVHYYGDASQFTGFLDTHVQAMNDLLAPGELAASGLAPRKWPVRQSPRFGAWPLVAGTMPLPIWATEVGVTTVTFDTWSDPWRRRRQADWILSTARQALAHPLLAVFMPFVLVHRGDGYAMTESAERLWPAWNEYARFTLENPFPARKVVRPPRQVNPVVLQWLADASTASGHKLSAAYRWRAEGAPIRGEIRIYNFGDTTVSGRLSQAREPGDGGWNVAAAPPAVGVRKTRVAPALPHRALELLTIPPGGMLSLPKDFALEDAPGGGRREWRQFTFTEVSGRQSDLGFALERSPELYPPTIAQLELAEWGSAVPSWDYLPAAVSSDRGVIWQAVNGVQVLFGQGGLARFQLGDRPFDPEFPPMAAARLPEGLPARGWIRVAVRELVPAGARVRLDLVDGEGRRFTQWENLGQVRGLPPNAPRWLNLLDFHPYAWGKLDGQRRLKPEAVREVQLRFFAEKGPTLLDVELGFSTEYGAALDREGEVRLVSPKSDNTVPVQ